MYDFHIHSDYSLDCKYSMEDMVVKALEKNMRSICFTDHIEFETTDQKLDIAFHTEDYFRKSKRVKYKYLKKIEILTGVEIGIQPHLSNRYSKFINENPFDFVLMSLHTIKGKDMYSDRYLVNKDPLEVTLEYYEELLSCINNFDNYDVVGHIDVIDRYFEDPSMIPEVKNYIDLVEKIFKKLISCGKGIELNTSGIRYGLDYYHPKVELLQLYRDLGGDIITIGSDAHEPQFVGYEYRQAEKLLKELGFKFIYIFKERKKVPIQIG